MSKINNLSKQLAVCGYDVGDDVDTEEVAVFFSAESPILDVTRDGPIVIETITASLESMLVISEIRNNVLSTESFDQSNFNLIKSSLAEHYNKLGFPIESVLAKEDFNPRCSKELALEGLGDFLKKCWDNLVRLLKWFADGIKSIFGFKKKEEMENISKNIRDFDAEIKRIILDHRYDMSKVNEFLTNDPDYQRLTSNIAPLCHKFNFTEIHTLLEKSMKEAGSCIAVPYTLVLAPDSLAGTVTNALITLCESHDKKEFIALMESPSILTSNIFSAYMAGYDAANRTAIQVTPSFKLFADLSTEERHLLKDCEEYKRLLEQNQNSHADMWFNVMPLIDKVFIAYKNKSHPTIPDKAGCALNFKMDKLNATTATNNKLYASTPVEAEKLLSLTKALLDVYSKTVDEANNRAKYLSEQFNKLMRDVLQSSNITELEAHAAGTNITKNKMALIYFTSHVVSISAAYILLVSTPPIKEVYLVFEEYFRLCTKAFKESEKSNIVI